MKNILYIYNSSVTLSLIVSSPTLTRVLLLSAELIDGNGGRGDLTTTEGNCSIL